MRRDFWVTALVASAIGLPACAQETDAAWERMTGAHQGAVGICPTDEATDNEACYLVRCNAKKELVFEIVDPMVGDFGLRSARFEIGNYAEVVTLDGNMPDTRSINLQKHSKFLTALRSKETSATMYSVKAITEYSTSFDLKGAKEQIDTVIKACR